MNHDVDDPSYFFVPGDDTNSRQLQDKSNLRAEPQTTDSNLNILSRIRKFNFARNSFGSLFSAPSSYAHPEDSDVDSLNVNYNYDVWDCSNDLESTQIRTWTPAQHQALTHANHTNNATDALTPTPTRPSTPLQHRFSDVKRIFTNFARSRQVHPSDHTASHDSESEYPVPLSHLSSSSATPAYASLSASASGSDLNATPPLTPDSLSGLALPSQETVYAYKPEYHQESEHEHQPGYMRVKEDDNADTQYTRPHSLEIKEGKKPERPYYDSFLADITGIPDALVDSCEVQEPPTADAGAIPEDKDEWYGLEYTLELSSRDRQPSEVHSSSVGEHSKSRESWAAIHQGTIDPFFEDEEYYQWKTWHRFLDKRDERRKHRRGQEFRARSGEAAWFWADEMRTRDVMYWQLEVYGVVAGDVRERLLILADHRPDPYYPAKKHNLGWYLKRSRSIASLRELRAEK